MLTFRGRVVKFMLNTGGENGMKKLLRDWIIPILLLIVGILAISRNGLIPIERIGGNVNLTNLLLLLMYLLGWLLVYLNFKKKLKEGSRLQITPSPQEPSVVISTDHLRYLCLLYNEVHGDVNMPANILVVGGMLEGWVGQHTGRGEKEQGLLFPPRIIDDMVSDLQKEGFVHVGVGSTHVYLTPKGKEKVEKDPDGTGKEERAEVIYP